jgi:hypothetical protein
MLPVTECLVRAPAKLTVKTICWKLFSGWEGKTETRETGKFNHSEYVHGQHDFYNFMSVRKFWERLKIQDYEETN